MRRSLYLIIVLNFFACTAENSVPDNILPLNKMTDIVFDMMKVDDLAANGALKDSIVRKGVQQVRLYQQVFAIHQTNKEEFYRSYKYYQQHPDIHKALFDSIYAHAQRLNMAKIKVREQMEQKKINLKKRRLKKE